MYCIMGDHSLCKRQIRWYDSVWVCHCPCHEGH